MTLVRLVALLMLVVTALPAKADPVEDFYKGKTIRLLVGFASGGYDTYSRLLASVMSKYIPGNPTIIVQNMPGGSSLNVANNLYTVAPKDGTVLGSVSKAMGTLPLLGGHGTDFENGGEFNWIGSMNQEFSVLVAWSTTGIKTLQDAQEKELVVAGDSPGADSMSLYPTVANKLLGTKLKMVYGYPGSNAMTLALERGEVSGRTWTWSTLKAERGYWLTENKINVIMQWSMTRAPDLPNVPTIAEFAKTDADRQVFELIFGPQVMARPIVAPPGVPADRVKALRAAFDASMKDKDLLAEAEKRKIEISPATGEEVQKIVTDSYKASPEVVKRAIELVPLVN
jgi:tripartite-type tricarboxylate transporter receptor subunit TctC